MSDTTDPTDSVEADTQPATTDKSAAMTPFSPATQQRVFPGRLLALDIVNERFVREFRLGLFDMMRRNADIVADNVEIVGVDEFQRRHRDSDSLNTFTMSPLRGTALLSLPSSLVYVVVDTVFGGAGRLSGDYKERDFTGIESRMIRRLVDLVLPCYTRAWQSVYDIEAAFERSELQVRFCNITSSPNEVIVLNTFKIEIGDFEGHFTISLPYSLLEPIRETLNRPAGQRVTAEDEQTRARQLAHNLTRSPVRLSATFAEIESTIGQMADLEVGDILPIDLPTEIEASIEQTPVLKGHYGQSRGRHAMRVSAVYDALNNEYGEQTDE